MKCISSEAIAPLQLGRSIIWQYLSSCGECRARRCKQAASPASGAAADPGFSSLGMTGECRLTFCALCFLFLAPLFLFRAECSMLWFQWGRSVTLCPSLPWNACNSHWRAPSHSIGISQPAKKYPYIMNFSKHEILSSIIKMVFPPSFSFHVWPRGWWVSAASRNENCRLPTKAFAFCQLVGITVIFTDTWLCLILEVTLCNTRHLGLGLDLHNADQAAGI